MKKETVQPYKQANSGKKAQVALMFNNIAKRYDFLNHFLSLGIDKMWRKKAVRLLAKNSPQSILDIATGTGDFAIELLKLQPKQIVGIDISVGMLEIGKNKIKKQGLDNVIQLQEGDSENLAFQDGSFDAITVGFGVRNFENLKKGLNEMHRVLKEGSYVAILEFSKPKAFPIKQIYDFYFKRLLPVVGAKISNDGSAYTYLPESVYAFPDGESFVSILEEVGFSDVQEYRLTFGIASIYLARA